ncbi:MAG: hypothetical protein GY856_24220 [bacterium]|nr:hypothetical protein [bacterium]
MHRSGLVTEFEFSAATSEALEFPALLALVARKAAGDLGRERLLGLRPFRDETLFQRHRERYEETRRLLADRPLVPLCDRPFGPLLAALDQSDRELDGRELVTIADLLQISAEAAERITTADPPCAELTALVEEVAPCAELRRSLTKTFDARGEIRADASPRLTELRSRIRGARNRIYDELSTLVDAERDHLSEETIPLRGGRLVVMLQAGARGKIPGLVHGRSGTGRSFYFEPLAAVELNNQLQQATEEEEAEKRRILVEMIATLRRELPAIQAHAELVAELDRLQASVRFAQESRGGLAELGRRHQFTLVRGRHPLLDPDLGELRRTALGQAGHSDPIVPLDLELAADRRALVVTGPNAGGKTVALKTVGLLALAHQCGLPIPVAKGSRLPFLRAIVATVGDDQDLLADRSTFSGRLLRLREAWQAAGADSLILLDELGSGTDPEEGAALATALVEALVERGCLTLVTTHLSQLAAAAMETEGALCAAMQFDADTGRPTYRLLPGPPGGSEALALARRLDLPAAWLDRAEELLGSEHRELRRLLAEVDRTRRELAAAHERLEIELGDAARLRERLAEQVTALDGERKRVGKTLKQKLDEFKTETLKRLRDEVERLRRELEDGRRKGLASAAVERLFAQAPELEPPADEDEDGEIAVGGHVRHRKLDWRGVLERLDRGRAQVRVEGKVFRCHEQDLAPASEPVPEPSQRLRGGRRAAARQAASRSAPAPEPAADDAPLELNLIGERVAPALDTLDRFLDRALLASHPRVRIIHGHGSGRLRAAVREHLRSHPAVLAQQPGGAAEGGDGATMVTLREG